MQHVPSTAEATLYYNPAPLPAGAPVNDVDEELIRQAEEQVNAEIPGLEGLPPLTQLSYRAYQRDLPRLLREKKPGQKGVAYHGERCLGFGASELELYERARQEGIPYHEVLICDFLPLLTEHYA